MVFHFFPGKFRKSLGIEGVVERAKVILTSAQIKALNSGPITILPTPGATKAIQVLGLAAKLKYGSIAYTGANALEFRYTNAAGSKVTGDIAAALINNGSNRTDTAIPVAVTAPVNAPIVACVPTANPAAGDGTIEIDILYRSFSTV
jgi:hypothetical protein